MTAHEIVTHEKWIEARQELLAKEKEFTRLRDALTELRQSLPWERVEKQYVFDGPQGEQTLSDLFEGCSQLIVYHFMYGPDWDAGCKSCSYLADHFNPAVVHLRQRDVSFAAVSKAPLAVLEDFKKRMGWAFKWVSSAETDFSRDYHVSFTQEEIDNGEAYYNYKTQGFHSTEAPGASVF